MGGEPPIEPPWRHARDRRTPGRRLVLVLAFAGALFGGTGCSFIVVEATPDWKSAPDRPPDCTASYLPAIVDGVLLLLPISLAAADLNKPDADFGGASLTFSGASLNRSTSIGFDLLAATAFTASAIYGYFGASACDQAIAHQREAWQERMLRQREAAIRDAVSGSDDTGAAAAAQAKAFGDAARAASPGPAKPAPSH